jgi:hypothetical protein
MGHVLGLSASLWNQFGLITTTNTPADAYVRLAMIRLMLRRAPITDQKSKLLGWALRSNRLGASTAASPCPRSPEGGGLSTRGEESASKLLPSGSPPVGIDLGELHSEQAYRGAVDCGDRAPSQSFAGWKDVGLSIIYVKTRTHSRKTSRSMERVRIPRVGGGVPLPRASVGGLAH